MEAFLIQLIGLILIIKGIIGIVNPHYLFTLANKLQKKKSLIRTISIITLILGVILFF